jgi:hypothetical protein
MGLPRSTRSNRGKPDVAEAQTEAEAVGHRSRQPPACSIHLVVDPGGIDLPGWWQAGALYRESSQVGDGLQVA